MATHSGNIAMEVPWAEEPGRLRFLELQRIIGQDQALMNAGTHHPSLINSSLNLPLVWEIKPTSPNPRNRLGDTRCIKK